MTEAARRFLVGVISDTHGTLPDTVLDAFRGVDAIVHAGDVGEGCVLDLLRSLAPVTAVRGNCDWSGEALGLPSSANVALGGVRFLVAHEKRALLASIDPVAAGARVVVTGHSHRPHLDERGGVTYLDPGSAADARGHAETVALVTIGPDGGTAVEFVEV